MFLLPMRLVLKSALHQASRDALAGGPFYYSLLEIEDYRFVLLL